MRVHCVLTHLVLFLEIWNSVYYSLPPTHQTMHQSCICVCNLQPACRDIGHTLSRISLWTCYLSTKHASPSLFMLFKLLFLLCFLVLPLLLYDSFCYLSFCYSFCLVLPCFCLVLPLLLYDSFCYCFVIRLLFTIVIRLLLALLLYLLLFVFTQEQWDRDDSQNTPLPVSSLAWLVKVLLEEFLMHNKEVLAYGRPELPIECTFTQAIHTHIHPMYTYRCMTSIKMFLNKNQCK